MRTYNNDLVFKSRAKSQISAILGFINRNWSNMDITVQIFDNKFRIMVPNEKVKKFIVKKADSLKYTYVIFNQNIA